MGLDRSRSEWVDGQKDLYLKKINLKYRNKEYQTYRSSHAMSFYQLKLPDALDISRFSKIFASACIA